MLNISERMDSQENEHGVTPAPFFNGVNSGGIYTLENAPTDANSMDSRLHGNDTAN